MAVVIPVIRKYPGEYATDLRPEEVTIRSTKDGSQQPALFYLPPAASAPVPLLVFLHSWSTDYKSAGGWSEVLEESRRRGWPVIVPNFRGANDHPEAFGSNVAVQDVLDSVAYASKRTVVDPHLPAG